MEIVLSPIGVFLVLPPAVIELLSLHRAQSNEFTELFQLGFEQVNASSQHAINDEGRSRHLTHLQESATQTNQDTISASKTRFLPPPARCIVQSKKLVSKWATNCQVELLGEPGHSSVANSTSVSPSPETLPSTKLLAHQLSTESPLLSSLGGSNRHKDINGFATSGW